MPSRPQVEAHRRDLADLTALALNDLRLIFDPIDSAELARDTLIEVLPRLVAIYGAAAATLAADWYDEIRAETAAARFTAIPAVLPDTDRTDALARWAVGPLFSATPDKVKALSLASGGLQRIIADADRQTITGSSIEDRAAKGWVWSSSGGCAFCTEQDGTLFTDGSSEMHSHDHCSCVAAPAFS